MAAPLDVDALIQGMQIQDSRLYTILTALNERLGSVEEDLNPLVLQSQLNTGTTTALLGPPATFTFAFTSTTVRFTWSEVVGAFGYELRKGTVWDTAAFQLRTPSLQADLAPLLVGVHTYLLKTIDGDGNYSTTAIQCVVTVPAVGAVTVSKQVIDNNVLLSWGAPTSVFQILNYEVSKDATIVGTVAATFFTRFEVVAGTYTYRVVAIDIAGNRGPNSDIAVQVLTPPDYALQDQRTSALGGTRTNVILESGPKLLANWAATTFQNHFTSRGWLTPQNQVTAGYPIYIQPANLTGSYEEVIDYGVTLSNVIATIAYNSNMITPAESMTVVIKMATSTDGISYSAFTSGASQFLSSLRFLKFRLEFTGSTDKALMEVYNVVISLNVKRENDGGEKAALLSDVGGTNVTFNKAFKDVETLTATVKSTTEPYTVIIKFNDIPNPVNFQVFVFDTTGNRVSKTVEWKARGIV
jgi:hypothetical protein